MARSSREWWLVLGVWLSLIVTNPGRNETVDVGIRQVIARRIWSAGQVTLDSRPPSDMPVAWLPVGPGRWAAPYGIGQSLLFIPFDAAGAFLEHISPPSWQERIGWFPIGLGLLPLLGVGLWLVMRRVLEAEGLEPRLAVVGSCAVVFGTIMFHYLGQGQEEMLVGLCLISSVLYALRLRAAPTTRNALASAAFAGACLVIRPVSVFSLLIVPVLLWSASKDRVTRIRILATAGLVVLLSIGVMLWYNFARFGSPFTIGYDRLGHVSKFAFDRRSPGILVSLLLGPGFGLLVLSPLLVVTFSGLGPLWRRDRSYLVGMTASVVSCYLFFSCWHDSYNGGVAWGTRYQCHLLPLYALPLALGIRRLSAGRWRRVLLVVAALSASIQVLSVAVTHHLEYVEAACQDGHAGGEELFQGFTKGQLGRRIRNVVRWVHRAGPPPCDDPKGRELIAVVWDRYVPNFWGPVIAHRIVRGGRLLMALWATLAAAALGALWIGGRGSSGSARVPRKPT